MDAIRFIISAVGGMQLFAPEAWSEAPLLLTHSAQMAQPTVRLPQLSQRWARPHWPSVTCAAACVSDTARRLPAHCETMGVRLNHPTSAWSHRPRGHLLGPLRPAADDPRRSARARPQDRAARPRGIAVARGCELGLVGCRARADCLGGSCRQAEAEAEGATAALKYVRQYSVSDSTTLQANCG